MIGHNRRLGISCSGIIVSDEMPDEKITSKLSEASILNARLDKFQESLESGFRNLRIDINLLGNDISIVKERMTSVENRVGAIEGSGSRRSDAVKALDTRTSQSDLAQDAQIARLIEQNQALEAQVTEARQQVKNLTAIAVRLESVASSIVGNRLVRRIAILSGYVVIGLLALIIIWLGSKGIHIEVPK
jgi:tetrahydromethanopterin S-methyltransferase subunit G